MDFWWLPVVGMVGTFVVIIVFVQSVNNTKRRRAELQAEIQTKLIDRFQSAPELIDFLKSPTGQEFVSGVKAQQTAFMSRRLVGGIRSAVFLGVLGVGFLVLWILANEEGFMYPGVLLLALGAGFYLSAVVSLKMSRDWGLDRPTESAPGDVR